MLPLLLCQVALTSAGASAARRGCMGAVPRRRCRGNHTVTTVRGWFETRRDGKWRAHAAVFAGLEGVDVAALTRDGFKERIATTGDTIFNAWRSYVAAHSAAGVPVATATLVLPLVVAFLLVAATGSAVLYVGFCFRASQTAFQMWKVLRSHEVVRVDSAAVASDSWPYGRSQVAVAAGHALEEIVRLPKGVEWMTEPASVLIVRKCWVQLYDAVVRRMNCTFGTTGEGVLITGNPGIDKRWFLSYLMYRCDQDFPERTIVLESVAKGLIWVFGADGSVRVENWKERRFLPELGATHKLLVYDVVEGTDKPCTEVVGRFASEHVLREFSKASLRLKKQQTQNFLIAATSRTELPPYVGVPFEMWAHERLARGGRFQVRRLDDDSVSDVIDELKFAELTTALVGRISDVPALQQAQADRIYFQPEGRTFPVFDALLRQRETVAGITRLSDTVALQMTVSRSHPLLHARRVEALTHLHPSGSDPFDVFLWSHPGCFRCSRRSTTLALAAKR